MRGIGDARGGVKKHVYHPTQLVGRRTEPDLVVGRKRFAFTRGAFLGARIQGAVACAAPYQAGVLRMSVFCYMGNR